MKVIALSVTNAKIKKSLKNKLCDKYILILNSLKFISLCDAAPIVRAKGRSGKIGGII